MENTIERTIRYLQDLHASEKASQDLLNGLAKRTDGDIDFRELAEKGALLSRNRSGRLSQRIDELGGQTSQTKDWMRTAVGQMGDLMALGHDNVDKNTMDLVRAFAGTQGLHAIYVALAAFATGTSDQSTRMLAEFGRDDTAAFATDLLPHIESTAKQGAPPQFAV